MNSTNYYDTFIAVAPDSGTVRGTVPRESKSPSIALRTFKLIDEHPYRYTSDDVLFIVHADRNGIPDEERAAARKEFVSEPRAWMRASDLGKKYGWGIHFDAAGRTALYGVESDEYQAFVDGERKDGRGKPLTIKFAMRSRRKSR